ncbi:smad nuclear-interacting protein 1-like [Sorex fumeus]|uniref:smad nuclear-interacting protein 1-like n=1 Tax=Sorex fumeus TaxID=62283 RepID=UPI0024AE877A|nr:smad nuclear-interacting protein 1-like [Sorex fumeus]
MRHGALSRKEAESERDRDRDRGQDGMEEQGSLAAGLRGSRSPAWKKNKPAGRGGESPPSQGGPGHPAGRGKRERAARQRRDQPSGHAPRRARTRDRAGPRGRPQPRTPSSERPGRGQARGRAGAAEPEPPGARRREHRRQQEAGAAGSGSRESDPRPGGHRRAGEEPLRERPSLELSGALLEDANAFRGVVVRYSEPPEARVPKQRWRLYPFKNEEALPVMHVHRQSAYLLGRHRRVADIPIDHPSCSKQHAVFQYRLAECPRADGTVGRRVKPYIIDLASGNGTFLNNQRIEPHRYYELKEKDVLKFGFSSREYVLLHEFSHTSEVGRREDEEEEGVSDS